MCRGIVKGEGIWSRNSGYSVYFAEGFGEAAHAVDGYAGDRRGPTIEYLASYFQRLLKVAGMTDEAGEFEDIIEGASYGVEGYLYVFEGLAELGTEITGKHQVFVFVSGDLA